MPLEKQWIESERISIPEDFSLAIGGHPIVAQTLFQRGYQSIEAAKAFLNPDAYQPTSADELPDIEAAYQLLSDSLQQRLHILVWGDFDVDGQTATTLLVEGLRALGAEVSTHIPIRGEESHGITREKLISYLKRGFDLLLTCDTGISEHDNIHIVRDAGIPVIITDHHSLGDTLPPANACINPQRLPTNHPLRSLPGVGVAYKLMEGLYSHIGRPFDDGHYLELSALGIVADVAEVSADTRYLLQKGLNHLRLTQRIGLQTLYKNAELNPANINEEHIGFQIAPRMNAVGRLGDANMMVEFLTTRDAGRARVLAMQIEGMNAKRRFLTRQVEKAAESQLQASLDDRHAPAIILHYPQWPGGILGIVAGRLAERYHKPVILLTGEERLYGSARSVQGVNITAAIRSQSDLLLTYGGHPMAAGLSLANPYFSIFKQGLMATIDAMRKERDVIPKIDVHHEIHLEQISLDFVEQLHRLAPFGPGNPPLNFMLRDLSLVSTAQIGQLGEHRQVIVSDGQENTQRFLWWNGGDEPLPEARFDLVCTLSQSNYKGAPQVSAQWIDYRLSETGQVEVARRKLEILDRRDCLNPIQELLTLQNQYPHALIWGEGDLPREISACGRESIHPAETLIIWTAPPSQAVVDEVLQQAAPTRIIVFGLDANFDTFAPFMQRLAGLAKFTANQKAGQAPLRGLAAACAAGEETIRVGLLLWQALGELSIDFIGEEVIIQICKSQPDKSTIDSFQPILTSLLEESRAYRGSFKKMGLDRFFPQ